MEPLYKVGDRIRVRQDIGDTTHAISINQDMLKLVGNEYTISMVTPNHYNSYRLGSVCWAWTDSMIEPVPTTNALEFNVGDTVTIRADLVNGKYTDSNGVGDTVVESMLAIAGTQQVIDRVDAQGKFRLKGFNTNWISTMFEPKLQIPEDCIQLPAGYYKPFEIPRKHKDPRKVCAPDPELLKYQRGELKNLEAAFLSQESNLGISNILHGFIKDRNCVTAAQKHVGYDLTLMMDIVAFFDSVTPEHTKINNPSLYTIDGYCGQGFASSPMLANIAILNIVKSIDVYLQTIYPDNYAFTMYADDIQISINTSNKDAEHLEANALIEVVTAAFEYYDFLIHPHKTRIRYAKHGYRRILGINVGNDHIRATRKTMRKIRAAKHQKNGPSAGGLTTWSKCYLPRKLREHPKPKSLPAPSIDDADAYIAYFVKAKNNGLKLDFGTPHGKWEFYGLPGFNDVYPIEYWVQNGILFRLRPQVLNAAEYTPATKHRFPASFDTTSSYS